MVGLREPDLSYRDIAARTGHAAMPVMRVWNEWMEEGRTQRQAGTGPRNVTTVWDDSHLVLMAVTDHTASSRVLRHRGPMPNVNGLGCHWIQYLISSPTY